MEWNICWDVCSRYCVLVPTKDYKAEAAAQVFHKRWVCLFGIPLMVQSDRRTHFTSVVFEETCSIEDHIELTINSTYLGQEWSRQCNFAHNTVMNARIFPHELYT
jgi:hypothetical protein